MHRIFKKHWEIFVQRAFNSKDAVKNFYNEISKFQRNKDIQDGTILHRFPKKELRYFLRAECPTEKPPEKKAVKSYEVIKSAKRLRYFMGISENFVCTRCSKRDTCKFRDTLPKHKETSLSDLLIVMNGVYDYRNQLYSGVEDQKEENIHENEELDEENIPEISENQPQDRYIYKTYDSAIKLIDTLYPVVDDLNLRKGYGSKQYINTYIEENKNLHKNRINVDESDQEDDFPQNNKRPYSFNKNPGKKFENRQSKEELSWGARPKKSLDNQGYKKNQPQRDPVDFREKRKFEKTERPPQKRSRRDEEQDDDIDFAPKKRDFSSKKNRPVSFDNDFSDEEDSFVIKKRSGIQTQQCKSFEADEEEDDEMFSIQKNKSSQGGRGRRGNSPQTREVENEAKSTGGRKIKRNKSETLEGKLNIDSFLHNVK